MNANGTPADQFGRLAYSPGEAAGMCAKHLSRTFRQVRKGRVKTITGYGTALVSELGIELLLSDNSIC